MLEEQRITPGKALELCIETGFSLRQGLYVDAEKARCCAVGLPLVAAVGEGRAQRLADRYRDNMDVDIIGDIAALTETDADYLKGLESGFENSTGWKSNGPANTQGHYDGTQLRKAVQEGALPGSAPNGKSVESAVDNVVYGMVPERPENIDLPTSAEVEEDPAFIEGYHLRGTHQQGALS